MLEIIKTHRCFGEALFFDRTSMIVAENNPGQKWNVGFSGPGQATGSCQELSRTQPFLKEKRLDGVKEGEERHELH